MSLFPNKCYVDGLLIAIEGMPPAASPLQTHYHSFEGAIALESSQRARFMTTLSPRIRSNFESLLVDGLYSLCKAKPLVSGCMMHNLLVA
jgi:hypothetical protein